MAIDSSDDARRPHFAIRWTLGVACIAVGLLLTMGVTRWNDRVQYTREQIERTGLATTATVIGVPSSGAPDGSICLTYSITTVRRIDECVAVGDASSLRLGQIVRIRFDAADPTHIVVFGYPPDRATPLLVGWLGGLASAAAGACLLALIRRETAGEPEDNFLWLVPMMLAGFTTWAGFGRVAQITRRRRRWWWAGLYLFGIVTAFALHQVTPDRPAIAASAFALWAAVWIGGLVHGLVILPEVCLAKRQATERRRPRGLLLPPGVPKGPYEGAVELAVHPSGHDVASATSGPSIVHAATKQGEVVCASSHEPLLPTYRSWPSLGQNPAIRCTDCTALVGPRPTSTSQATVSVLEPGAPENPIWVWRDHSGFANGVAVYLCCVAWAQVWMVAAFYNPDLGGNLVQGTIALLINLALVAWLSVRGWRRRTEVHPYGFRVVRMWSTVTVAWSEVGSFADRSVFTREGAKVPLPGIKSSGEIAARFNQLCGVVGARIGNPRGLVELPTSTPLDSMSSSGRSGILHVADADGGPLCRFASGPCLPTLHPWRDQDLGCLVLCDVCTGLEPPAPRSWVPYVPFTRPAEPEPGHEWVRALTPSESWAVFAIWIMCGGWILLLPGVWMLYRFLRLSSAVGAEGVRIRSFPRTRWLPWSEIRGFEMRPASNNKHYICAMTVRNEPVRLQSLSQSSVDDLEQLVQSLNALVERVQNLVPV